MLVSFVDDHTGFGNGFGLGNIVPGFTSKILSVPKSTNGDVSITLEYFGDFDVGGPTESLTINIEGVVFGPYTGQQYNGAFGPASPTTVNFTIDAATWATIIKDGIINISYDIGTGFNNLSDAPGVEEFIKLHFEWDVSATSGDDRLRGTSGDDTIHGLGGDDTIWGNAGNDRLSGGSGNDTIYGGDGDDLIWGGSGDDTLSGGNGNDQLSGGSGYDSISGGEGDDLIWGGSGNDKLSGGNGNDKIAGGSGNDSISGGSGNDRLSGGCGKDTISGGDGNDLIWGGAGNDRIIGGAGSDKLSGGSGADTFVFKSIKDSTTATSGRDTIYDFSRKEGDKIDLKAIDANTKSGGNQAFKFIGTDAFHKKAGELRYEKKSGDTYVYGDVNGDGKADFAIKFDALISFSKGDFIL